MKRATMAVLAVSFCSAIAFGAPNVAKAEVNELDFSRPGYNYVTITAAEFLEDRLELEVAGEEREYFSAFPRFNLSYSADIPGRYISAEYNQNADELSVSASEYSYKAVNGSVVVWKPTAINGVELSDGRWTAVPSQLSEDYVTVTYSTELTVPKSIVNGLVNGYYSAAESASLKLKEKQREYSEAVEEYHKKEKQYEDYLKAVENYNSEINRYNAYLAELAEWDRKNERYLDYLDEYSRYRQELKEYEEYDPERALEQYLQQVNEYKQYEQDLKTYEKKYAEYLASMDTPEMEKVETQLGVLAYMYKVAGEGRTIRNAIMGNSVTQVLQRKDELKLVPGLDVRAVDYADTATKNLRNLISNYETLKDDQSKYTFYVTSYESLKDNFTVLLQSLDYLYRNSTVRSQIVARNRDLQFRILLAQLFEISHALTNGKIGNFEQALRWNDSNAGWLDETYTIYGEKPEDLLGKSTLADNEDALPLENGYPASPDEPKKPTEVAPPEYPERPKQPYPPEEVLSPGPAPQEMSEPVQPENVSAPVLPVEYQPDEWELRLAAEFDRGNLVRRQELLEDFVLDLHTDVKKYFRNYNSVTVYFYPDFDSSEYLYFDVAEEGSAVEYPEEFPLPEKQMRGYTCVFSHWVYEDNSPVDWGNLPRGVESINVYPAFEQIPNLYQVIWIIDGVSYPDWAEYGTIPQYLGTPEKPDDGYRQFRFVGWDKTPVEMSDSVVYYRAVFQPSSLITWHIGNDSYITSVFDGVPECPVAPEYGHDNLYVYIFEGWDVQPVEVCGDAEYTALFGRSYIVPLGSAGGAVVKKEDGVYTADCTGVMQNEIKISSLIAIAAADNSPVVLVASAFTVRFSAAEVYEVMLSGAETISIDIRRIRSMEYSYSASVGAYSGSFTLTVYGAFDSVNSRLFKTDKAGEKSEARLNVSPTYVTFTMRADCSYEIYPLYAVNLVQSGGISLSVSSRYAKRGEVVTIKVDSVAAGMKVGSVYVLDSSGNTIEVSNEYMFVVPASDVTVGAAADFIEYTVIFRSDGKIISRKTYRYGETVALPVNPIKAPDGKFSYVFTGWDVQPVAVTCDAEYTALFTAMPLPEFEDAGMSRTMIILLCAAGGGAALLVGGVVLTVVLVRRRKKEKNSV